LNDSGLSWGVYFEEIPTVLQLADTRKPEYLEHNFHGIAKFAEHCQSGTLPAFSFVEPIYFETGVFSPASDQHPSHDVSAGEKFMASIYQSVRNSTVWNDTLLIITYDEHGGFYDHVPTPLDGIPNPDGLNYTHKHDFGFNRLGVRVPTIMISPYIEKGTVVHDPPNPKTPTSKYDHSSIHATLMKLFDIPNFLTKR
jgi:phospholipase C